MKFLLWLKKESFRVLPVFLFFLLFFTLINWTESLLFEHMGVTPFKFVEIVIAAALIAKIVLFADHLPIIDLFRKQPLIYGIFWKTTLYSVFLLIIRFAIRVFPVLLASGKNFTEAFDQFVHSHHWNIFVSIQIYYVMLLFIFVTFQELAVKIGPQKLREILFGKQQKFKR